MRLVMRKLLENSLNTDYGRIERHSLMHSHMQMQRLNTDYGRIERSAIDSRGRGGVGRLNTDYGRIESILSSFCRVLEKWVKHGLW